MTNAIAQAHDRVDPDAEDLLAQLQQTRDRLDAPRVYLLYQMHDQAPETDLDLAGQFGELLDDQRLTKTPIQLQGVPAALSPCLVALDLRRGLHAAIALLAMQMACEDRTQEALVSARSSRTCAWIFNGESPTDLATTLAQRAIQPHPARPIKRWVRYYEPLITDIFWQACTPSQREWYMGGASEWLYLDRWGSLNSLCDTAHDAYVARPTASDPLWQRLAHVGAMNQAWTRASRDSTPVTKHAWEGMIQSLSALPKHLLQGSADADTFAWHALTMGPGFHMHPKIMSLLREVGPQTTYAELAYEVETAQWESVASELRSSAAVPI